MLRREKDFMNFLNKIKIDIMVFWQYEGIFFEAGNWLKDNLSLLFMGLA